MNEKAQRYPLAWPMNWKRTRAGDRRRADFRKHTTKIVMYGGQSTERTERSALTISGAILS